ncbi:MAG TPA: cytochrome c biogenesis protein CcsA [Fimbriimonadaceae bacterium]|nr:cytochrome c biogenesis protein CcsA [Fimbriimonadaceae bacterium]
MENQLPPMPDAPALGMALGFIGKGFIFGAILFFAISAFGWFRSKARLGKISFWVGALCLFGAFGSLAALFLGNQFQYEYVFGHAEADLEFKYKIAAIWSGQQGSFLLWAVTSAIFGLLAGRATGIYRRWFTIPYALFLAALGAILAYETPFNLIPEIASMPKPVVPPTGTGLTPSLQNYWVVIHPPTIFMGFGSLTVLFCWAIAAMMERNPIDWAKMIRPWAIGSAAILGLGLMMGGFWAYETLGWGGFWAWDPVENVSFVPWILVACLIHGLIIQISRGRYVGGNLMLAGLPFIAFVYGTFLTRSGFLGSASVHSFAEMQRGALWVLVGIGVATLLTFFGLYIVRGRRLALEFSNGSTPKGLNREAYYQSAILLLSGIGAATAIGMSMPFLSSVVVKRNVAIEEWLYHQVLSWAYIPVIALIGLVPFISWKGLTAKELFNKILNIVTISVGLTGLALFFFRHPDLGVAADPNRTTLIAGKIEVGTVYWVAFLVFLSLFAAIGNIWRIVESLKRSPMSIGGFVAHLGLAVFMAGMVVSRGLEKHAQVTVQRSRPGQGLGYVVSLRADPDPAKLTDRNNKVEFDVKGPDGSFVARPGLYYTDSGDGPKPMFWPHIQRHGTHDVYFALGAPAMNYWDNPESFKVGESKTLKGVTVTYKGYDMIGEPGQPGTKFVGKVDIAYDKEQFQVSPALSVSDGPDMPPAGEFRVMMTRIDAATKGAEIQLFFREALYPIDLYYKPMTGLVWAGAGILAIGGFLAAFYRRPKNPKSGEPVEPEPQLEEDPNPDNKDAPAPVA